MGRVLEVMDAQYTRRFGTNVTRSDVLDIDAGNANATVVADLAAADAIESASFDCFILIQNASVHLRRGGRDGACAPGPAPGGTVLCTAPVTSRIRRAQIDRVYWRFHATCLQATVREEVRSGSRGRPRPGERARMRGVPRRYGRRRAFRS